MGLYGFCVGSYDPSTYLKKEKKSERERPTQANLLICITSMLGSRSLYRRILSERGYLLDRSSALSAGTNEKKLSVAGEGVAGMFAGWTVSFVAAPVEHVKARLQIQYSAEKARRLYSGPIDCSKKLVFIT